MKTEEELNKLVNKLSVKIDIDCSLEEVLKESSSIVQKARRNHAREQMLSKIKEKEKLSVTRPKRVINHNFSTPFLSFSLRQINRKSLVEKRMKNMKGISDVKHPAKLVVLPTVKSSRNAEVVVLSPSMLVTSKFNSSSHILFTSFG